MDSRDPCLNSAISVKRSASRPWTTQSKAIWEKLLTAPMKRLYRDGCDNIPKCSPRLSTSHAVAVLIQIRSGAWAGNSPGHEKPLIICSAIFRCNRADARRLDARRLDARRLAVRATDLSPPAPRPVNLKCNGPAALGQARQSFGLGRCWSANGDRENKKCI